MPPVSPLDSFRTTVRLSRQTYDFLKQQANSSGRTAESIIEETLKNALPKASYALGVEHPEEWGDLLATRFIQFMPALFVLKHSDEAVVYANPAYEREFKVPLNQLRGKKITDFAIGLLERGRLSEDFHDVAKSREAAEFMEPVTHEGGRMSAYHTVRYAFDLRNSLGTDQTYIADFSYPWACTYAAKDETPQISTEEMCQHVLTWPVKVQGLCRAALEHSPVALVIKDASSMKIVWANEVFFNLAKKSRPELASRDELIGQTTKAVWKLDDYHPIVLNDESVKATNQASYFNEPSLPDSGQGRGAAIHLRDQYPSKGQGFFRHWGSSRSS